MVEGTSAEGGIGVGTVLAYPVVLDQHDDAVLATSPDFPELVTSGVDQDEAVARAVQALENAIAARIRDRKDIPSPSQGAAYAVLPTLTSVKVMLYQHMREQGITKAELARRLGWHLPQVDRVLDVQHRSWLDQIDAALGAIDRQLHVSTAVSLGPAVTAVGDFDAMDSTTLKTVTDRNLRESGEGIGRA